MMFRQSLRALPVLGALFAALAVHGTAAAQTEMLMRPGEVFAQADSTSEVVRTFRSAVKVTALRCVEGWCEITWFEEDSRGFVPMRGAFTNQEEVTASRYERLGWPRQMALAVARGEVLIGMTAQMVLEALGDPDEVNATEFPGHTREQWVYEGTRYRNTYVYLEDGVVTAVQK